ncbi:MAG: Ig-like domain-containing protein [Pseudomonadota bacterium]
MTLGRKKLDIFRFRPHRYILMLIVIMMCGWNPVTTMAEDIGHHYYDLHQNSLEKYDAVWDMLHTYYGEHLPMIFTVVYYSEDSGSYFNPSRDKISLSIGHLYSSTGGPGLVAHESSHIGLHHFTAGASMLEQFRFIDEGLANIMGAIAADKLPAYKEQALNVAKVQQTKNNVSFGKVQKWSVYYGPPGTNPNLGYAYDVGASFNFFVMDNYGEERFWKFVKDIGTTRDLGKSSQNVLNIPMKELESKWLLYLAAVKYEPILMQPQIVDMFPANNAINVPTDLKEIVVHFNTDMMQIVCIKTPCGDTGLCYKKAYWKDSRTLAVKIDGSLKPDYTYSFSLGLAGKCGYRSTAGIDMAVTPWAFTTEAK